MSLTMKPRLLALSVAVLLSACNTVSVDTAQQFTAHEQDEQAALAMITETINNKCAAEGLTVESAEYSECFWQQASVLRKFLLVARNNEIMFSERVNGAHAVANRKLSVERTGNARGPQERREQLRSQR